MRTILSVREIDALGAAIAKDFLAGEETFHINIDQLVLNYLHMKTVYVSFAEEDSGKIGFLSNGIDPLLVHGNGKRIPVVYPEKTIVIEKYLLRTEENCRRRFTLAHEAAHMILEKHLLSPKAAAFHNHYQVEQCYTSSDLRRMFSLSEYMADRLASAILMPTYLVRKALEIYHDGKPICYFEGGVYSLGERAAFSKMAEAFEVSDAALFRRLRELDLLNVYPIEDYLKEGLMIGNE